MQHETQSEISKSYIDKMPRYRREYRAMRL